MPPVKRRPFHAALASAFCLASLLAGMLAAAPPAGATDAGRAERLYSKGLAELHAGKNEEALALFQQAVDVDPGDARCLYYRALGYGRLGRFDEAVADLKRVVAANDPVLVRDRLELGYALYRTGDLDGAAAELTLAAERPDVAAEALVLLGIVESRRGNHDAAIAALQKAERLDPSRAVASRYYQGLAAWRASDTAKAREDFTWVATRNAHSPFGREANSFLDQMDRGGSRRWRLNAGLAFEYDSNVALAPDDKFLAENVYGISNNSDGRAVLTAGAKAALVSQGGFALVAGYDFLQSLHFDLERFDVQTHGAGFDTTYVHGPFTFGVGTEYEFSLLDEASLMHAINALPWMRYDEGELGHAEVYYRMRWRDFLADDFSPVRDSTNHAAGARQFFALGQDDRNVIVGYRFDSDIAAESVGNEFNYDGHQVEFGFQWAFTDDMAADIVYAYRAENYSKASQNRDDDEHTVITRLERRLHEYLWLVTSYIYRRNLSDQESFEYARHITSLGVEARY